MEVGIDQFNYTILEDVGQLDIWVSITSGQTAPDEQWQIVVETIDVSAVGELVILCYLDLHDDNLFVVAYSSS